MANTTEISTQRPTIRAQLRTLVIFGGIIILSVAVTAFLVSNLFVAAPS